MSFYSVGPAGSNGQIQFNDNGGFGGDVDLTYNKTTNKLTTGGDVELNDGGSFTTTLQVVTPTAARTISFPNATGTVGLVAGSSGQLVYNNAGAYAGVPSSVIGATGDVTLALNGAASTPPLELTGTWFTGGTATTTKPQVLIEPAGTTSTAWSTSGTGLGVNAASGFTGRLLDLQLNGTSRVAVQADGNVGIGTTSPLSILQVGALSGNNTLTIGSSPTGIGGLYFADGTATASYAGFVEYSHASNSLQFGTNSSYKATIDSSGRLLVGTSSARSIGGGLTSAVQIEAATDFNKAALSIVNNSNDSSGSYLVLGKSRAGALNGNTIVQNGDLFGDIRFAGADGTDLETISARISAEVDGTPGTDDMPGRLVFSTNAGGPGGTTERARIDSSGRLLVGTATNTGGSLFQVNDNRIRIATAKTPASATDTGSAGEICWDADYIYVCTATNTWKRAALSTW
jgi:hypothetical protein